MRKLLVVQVSLLILFAGGTVGMIYYTDIYEDIQSTIVLTTCFSCIKMDPVTRLVYTFTTANNKPHPSFILDNLTKGPVFLGFRQDVCHACDEMDPIMEEIFNVQFGKKELFYKTINYEGSNVSFFHINLDHTSGDFKESFYIYDKDQRVGVPMFVIITLGNNNGVIEPYYTTAYAMLGFRHHEQRQRERFLRDMITQGIDFYNQYEPKYG